MIILVTGSEGVIGSQLTKALHKAGHTVYCADLKHSSSPNYYRTDVSNYRELTNTLTEILKKEGKIDLIYHLAADVGRISGELYYDRIWNTNAVGVKNILLAQINKLFDKLIFFSSSEVYGDLGDTLLTEDLIYRKALIPKNDYGISKLVNEYQIINHMDKTGLPVMTLRIFFVYGEEFPSPYRSAISLFSYSALNRIPYVVHPNCYRSFIHMDDMIPTVVNCATNFYPEIFNIGTDVVYSMKELNDIILHECGIEENPPFVLYEQVNDFYTVIKKQPSISKARERLGHNPQITLQQGITKTISWLKQTYGQKV